MILDYKDRWVICTPTKTGTTSLTVLLSQQLRVATKELPVHRPDWTLDVRDRLMTVRHPLDRWVSMWYFLARDKSRMHQAAAAGLVPFAEEYFKRYDQCDWSTWHRDIETYMWLAPLHRFIDRFKPTSLHDVVQDGGASVIEHLNSNYGYSISRVPHLRKSKERRPWRDVVAELERARPALLERLVEWAAPDFVALAERGMPYEAY